MIAFLTTVLIVIFGISIIVCLGCKLTVIYLMFWNEEIFLPIICLVLSPIGIGSAIAFLFGWLDAEKYDCRGVMRIWTVAILVALATGLLAGWLSPDRLARD